MFCYVLSDYNFVANKDLMNVSQSERSVVNVDWSLVSHWSTSTSTVQHIFSIASHTACFLVVFNLCTF